MDKLLVLLLEVYRAAQETPVTEFPDLALELLKTAVPFRSATWSHAVYFGGRVRFLGAFLHNEPREMLEEFVALNKTHTNGLDAARNTPGRAVIQDTPEVYSGSDQADMRAYLKRYGHERNLMIADPAALREGGGGEWLSLYRPGTEEQFSEQDRSLLTLLLPHFVEAITINRCLVPGAQQADSARRSGARAVVDRHGVAIHCGARFVDLMRREWPDCSDVRIPDELVTQLRARGTATYAGNSVHVSAVQFGDALVLTARQPSPLGKLSPRERQIAQHFGGGLSYKEIAHAEQISPATVRNLLQRAYRKLGIANKTELARLLADPGV